MHLQCWQSHVSGVSGVPPPLPSLLIPGFSGAEVARQGVQVSGQCQEEQGPVRVGRE